MEVSFRNALNLWNIFGCLMGLGEIFFYAVDTFQSNFNSKDPCNDVDLFLLLNRDSGDSKWKKWDSFTKYKYAKLWTCGHGSKYLLHYFIYFSGKSPSVGQCLISLNLTRTKAHTQNCKNQDTFPLWHALHRSLDCQHLKKLLLDFQISVKVSLKIEILFSKINFIQV